MQNLISSLRHRLQDPLPGISAQIKMIRQKMEVNPENIKRFKAPEDHKAAAVLALLYQKDNEWHTALMQRPESPYPHSRQVSFPGGGFEENVDQNYLETALRETEEEFGISRTKIEVIGQLTQLYIPVSNYLVHPFVGFIDHVPLFVPDAVEVDEIVEVPIYHLIDPANRKIKSIKTHGGLVLPDTPYFELNQKVVWGATAMMLSEFAEILEEVNVWKSA